MADTDGIIQVVESPIADSTVIDAWLVVGDAPASYTPPIIEPQPPTPYLVPPAIVAAAMGLTVTPEMMDISNPLGEGLFNIVATMYIDVGLYWFFFNIAEPDNNYFAVITGGPASITMTDHEVDYFALVATDDTGAPFDPVALNVQIYRIAT